jgi:manganese-dependent inorganic pyrophosphatase
MSIQVFGHLAPDTDSTCTPLVYAWYLTNILNTPAQAVITGEINKEAAYVLKKFELEKPKLITELQPSSEVVIIDTNNPEELLPGINETNILEIIDHHKLVGGLSTSEPLTMTIRKYGCVATLVWEMIKDELPSETPNWVYGLLMAAITSDTLKMTSPTTTENDRAALVELSGKSGLSIDEFAEELFSAKSDLTGMSAEDVILSDSKVFTMGSKKVRVAVLETAKPQNVLTMKEDILTAMNALKIKEGSDYLFFYIVNILENSSELLASTAEEKELAKKAHSANFEGETMKLPGVVSRKKQMVPKLEAVIA